MVNIDNQNLRAKLLSYCARYNVQPVNTSSISQDPSVDVCAESIRELTSYLLSPIEQNIKKELTQMFIDSENPEIPYFEVVMDVMQFMNDFIGDPHTVELIFARINNDTARKKLELDDKIFYSDTEWTDAVAEAAIQKLRDSGTARDYQFMIDSLLGILSHSTGESGIKTARMRLGNIIKKHSVYELDKLESLLEY